MCPLMRQLQCPEDNRLKSASAGLAKARAIAGDTARLMMPLRAAKLLKRRGGMEGQIPAVITPDNLQKILGIKSPQSLAKIPIPRCHLYPGSKKYVYLAADVLDYLRGQRDTTEIDLD